MATIFDFDAYNCQKLQAKPGRVARQKLVYGLHRYAVIKTGRPFFDSPCYAFPLGPLFLELHGNYGHNGNPAALTEYERAIVDDVLEKLGAMSGKALAARSHVNYYEWRVMREGMRPDQTRVNGEFVEIPVSLIRGLPISSGRVPLSGTKSDCRKTSSHWPTTVTCKLFSKRSNNGVPHDQPSSSRRYHSRR